MSASPIFTINPRDFWHGLIIAAGTAAFTIVEVSLDQGSLKIDWKQVGIAAIAGGITYIGKKFLTSSKRKRNEIK